MIDHRRKLVFVHISRTGGTSIEAALVGKDWWHIEPSTKHLSASQVRALYGENVWNTYTKFTVIRNPWDRVISMWATRSWHRSASLPRDCSLEHFITKLEPHPHEEYGSLLCCDILDEELDFVLRFENLQADFDHMMTSTGREVIALPHLEKRQRKPYAEMYNETEKKLVKELFREDILRFGYSF